MHPEAAAFVALTAERLGPFESVLELGGRAVNGSVRRYFNGARYLSVDITPGREVDVVADATTYRPEDRFDAVVCTEVLEHVEDPDGFVATAWGSLRLGGVLILTMACPSRAAHSGVDGGPLRPGEFYRNVDPDLLARWLVGWKDAEIETHEDRGDMYAVARKPD
jgi:SAM-dependent methyltransferase